jgi:hypothetical protein
MKLKTTCCDAPFGYARVSAKDQTPLPQSQALKSAGCAEIHEEQASGGNRARPVLARVLARIGITLQAICNRLEAMRERTPRGRTDWSCFCKVAGIGHSILKIHVLWASTIHVVATTSQATNC